MPSIIQIKRRLGGTEAAPSGTDVEGELALWFPNDPTHAKKPTLYANDGGGWSVVNPDVTITTQSADLTIFGSASVQAASTAFVAANGGTVAKAYTGNVVVGTFGSPAQAYVLVDPKNHNKSSGWVSLGGAVSFADATEIHTGTDTTKALNSAILRGESLAAPSTGGKASATDEGKLLRLDPAGHLDSAFLQYATDPEIKNGTLAEKVINPKTLRAATLNTPSTAGKAGPADADKIVRLNSQGQIDPAFLTVKPLKFQNTIDVTTAYSAPTPVWHSGDFGVISKNGVVHGSWNTHGPATGTAVKKGDLIIYDGTKYHIVAQDLDLSAYLLLSGGAMTPGNKTKVTFAPATKDGSIVIIDGGQGQLKDVVIDCAGY